MHKIIHRATSVVRYMARLAGLGAEQRRQALARRAFELVASDRAQRGRSAEFAWSYDACRGAVIDRHGQTVAEVSHEAADSLADEAEHGALLAEAPMLRQAVERGGMLAEQARVLLAASGATIPGLMEVLYELQDALNPIQIDEPGVYQ